MQETEETGVWFLGWEDPLEGETKWQPTPIFMWEDPVEKGTWWVTACGVIKSQTGLSTHAWKHDPRKHPKRVFSLLPLLGSLGGTNVCNQSDTVEPPDLIAAGCLMHRLGKRCGEMWWELSPRRKDKGLSKSPDDLPWVCQIYIYLLGQENNRPTGAAQSLFSKQAH